MEIFTSYSVQQTRSKFDFFQPSGSIPCSRVEVQCILGFCTEISLATEQPNTFIQNNLLCLGLDYLQFQQYDRV